MDNNETQSEELEVLSSIYNKDWSSHENIPNTFSMQVDPRTKLFVTLNEGYPLNNPPSYELLAPYLSAPKKGIVEREFQNICLENIGAPILYQWIEKLKEIIADETLVVEDLPPNIEVVETCVRNRKDFEITSGSTIQDRKSVFQGHACRVNSADDVKQVMSVLLENKKIAGATHNILAYRIKQDKYMLKDCADDGESKAGANLLELLEILNLTNVLVVVSRWYGGVHLGPDRFRHIKNAARQVLEQAGFITEKDRK